MSLVVPFALDFGRQSTCAPQHRLHNRNSVREVRSYMCNSRLTCLNCSTACQGQFTSENRDIKHAETVLDEALADGSNFSTSVKVFERGIHIVHMELFPGCASNNHPIILLQSPYVIGHYI